MSVYLRLAFVTLAVQAQIGSYQKIVETVRHSFQWAVKAGGPNDVIVNSMAADSDGNVVVAGLFDTSVFELYDSLNRRMASYVTADRKSGFLAMFGQNGR